VLNADEISNIVNDNTTNNKDHLLTEGLSFNYNINKMNFNKDYEKSLKHITTVLSEDDDQICEFRNKRELKYNESGNCLTSSSILNGTRLNRTFYLIKHKRMEQLLNSSVENSMHDRGGHHACCRLKKNYELNISQGSITSGKNMYDRNHKRSTSMPNADSFFNKIAIDKDGNKIGGIIINNNDDDYYKDKEKHDDKNNIKNNLQKFQKYYKKIELKKKEQRLNKEKEKEIKVKEKEIEKERENYLISISKIKYAHIQSRYNKNSQEQNGRNLLEKSII
jgi:hypothetical protein